MYAVIYEPESSCAWLLRCLDVATSEAGGDECRVSGTTTLCTVGQAAVRRLVNGASQSHQPDQ